MHPLFHLAIWLDMLMSLIVYHIPSLTSQSWGVLSSGFLHSSNRQHQTPAASQLNPHARVPVLASVRHKQPLTAPSHESDVRKYSNVHHGYTFPSTIPFHHQQNESQRLSRKAAFSSTGHAILSDPVTIATIPCQGRSFRDNLWPHANWVVALG